MKKKILLALALACGVAFTSAAHAATLFFDFGDAGAAWATPSSANYNAINVNPTDPANLILFNTMDSTGAWTGIGAQASGFFTGANYNGPTAGAGTASGDAAAIFHPGALNDNAFGHVGTFNGTTNPTGTVLFSGLDASGNTTYSFTMFGSRMGVADNRETQYTVSGVNSGVSLLNTSANTSNVANVLDIVPNANGEITLSITAGPNNTSASKFWYLGALRIESTTSTIPEPGTLSLLALSGLALVVKRRTK